MALFSFSWTDPLAGVCRNGAVTFGNFDGVHRGHQALLHSLGEQAKVAGGPAVAVTFDPHPMQLLRPQQFQPVLTTVAHRAELLQAAISAASGLLGALKPS